MTLKFFLAMTDDVFVLSLNSIVSNVELLHSVLIVSALIESFLDFTGQSFSSISELISQIFNFQSMVSIAILELASQTFKVSLVKPTDFDLI